MPIILGGSEQNKIQTRWKEVDRDSETYIA